MQVTPLSLLVAILAASATAQAQTFLIAPNSATDVVALIDANTGAIINPTFIQDDPTSTLYNFSTPKDAFQVNDEIWVTDQVSDQIIRFDLNGNHIATILPAVGMVDNMRGGCFANNTVYVTSDGTGNGAPGNSVVLFDRGANRLGSWPAGDSPFDVLEFNGELLVTDFGTPDAIRRYSYAGTYLGDFLISDGVTGPDAIEHISISSTGTLFVTSFSMPQGIFEYSATGTQLNYFPITGLVHSAMELGNGLLLHSTQDPDLSTYDRSNGALTLIAASGYQFISRLEVGPAFPVACFGDGGDQMGCTNCPCGNNAVAGTMGGCLNSAANSAKLLASGTPDVTTPADTLHFDMTGGNLNTFAVLISGANQLPTAGACPPGSGIAAASLDGLRCVGGSVVRHGSRSLDAMGNTTNGWGPPANPMSGIGVTAGFVMGQVRHFQVFYRENPLLGCQTGQNTSNSVSVTFE